MHIVSPLTLMPPATVTQVKGEMTAGLSPIPLSTLAPDSAHEDATATVTCSLVNI